MPKTVLNSCCQMEIPFEFLDIHNHPTPTDLEKNMSKELVDVYLKTCTPIERTLFGREKPLKGPGKLWINPHDRSDVNMTHFTPIKTEIVQALTHQGILEIGLEIEVKMNEESKKKVQEAVIEAEELAKFQADQRVKFHVEIERKNLNEDWQKRINQLMTQHDEEMKNLQEQNENSREILIEFLTKKFEKETEILISKAVEAVRNEMNEKCSKLVDSELVEQSILFQEQMANTIKNLEVNDNDRMEEMKKQCLHALDLQNDLMVCKQITEMMQMMKMENQHQLMQMTVMENDYKKTFETMKHPVRSHQSKLIKELLMEFIRQLEDFDLASLDRDDRETFSEIHRVLDKLKIDLKVDQYGEVIVIQEPSVPVEKIRDKDWIDKSDENCSEMFKHTKLSPLIDVKWEKFESDIGKVQSDVSFVTSVFNRLAQPQHFDTIEVASAIISMVKTSNDNTQLLENVAQKIQDAIMKKLFLPLPQYAGLVPMPKTEALKIKNSLETMEKRVSIQEEKQIESHQLLGVVDSLELLSKSTSRAVSKKSSTVTAVIEKSSALLESTINLKSINVLNDEKTNEITDIKRYVKMTDDDWNYLENIERIKQDGKPSRESTVHFNENEPVKGCHRLSGMSSILKRSSIESQNQFDVKQNALHLIQEKCRKSFLPSSEEI